MKRTLLLLAAAVLVVDASGCGACRNLFGSKAKPMATPVITQYAPSCTPGCDACGSSTPVTYDTAPGATFVAPPAYETSPMTVPAQMPAGSGMR